MKLFPLLPCFLLLAVIFTACQSEKVEPPFSEDKMKFVLRDMILLESSLSVVEEEQRDSVQTELSDQLLREHDIDEEQLQQFKQYLESHPEKSKELHDQLRDEFKKLERVVK